MFGYTLYPDPYTLAPPRGLTVQPPLAAPVWERRLRAFAPDWLRQSLLSPAQLADAAVLLHGSTTLGVDDAHSDLDVWVLLPDAELASLEPASPIRFFPFELEGKPGHFNLEGWTAFRQRLRTCDLPLVAELRHAALLHDPRGWGKALLENARQPMGVEVRKAWFRYHYVEMRGAHRACDNPIERCDPVALLQALSETVSHALRAALVLHGEPYPYIKWLHRAAAKTATGQRLLPLVDRLLEQLAEDGLRHPGPENGHPLSLTLRAIRLELIAAAEAKDVTGPWLREWWLHIDAARRGVAETEWGYGLI